MRNPSLIEERNRRLAQAYHELAPRLRNYSEVVSALSRIFFLSEYRVQAIIRQMVRQGTFEPSPEAAKHVRRKAFTGPSAINIQLKLSL